MAMIVGQPIVAAAAFQAASSRPQEKGRLKTGPGQDCPPHIKELRPCR